MDYKLNILARELKCEEVGLPDFPALLFGKLDEQTLVFNATQYLKSIERECDYKDFSRAMRFWIDRMTEGYGADVAKLFYQNPNGDQLYSEILTHLFLVYLDPAILVYYNDMVDDAMTNGIAFSDSFITELAQTRLTPDIIKTLNNGNSKKNSGI